MSGKHVKCKWLLTYTDATCIQIGLTLHGERESLGSEFEGFHGIILKYIHLLTILLTLIGFAYNFITEV